MDRARMLAFVTAVSLATLGYLQAADVPQPPPSPTDAALRAVAFAGDERIVVVGDRGTILISNDGGMTWATIPSRTVCNLKNVYFLDELRGWAVGGQAIPRVPDSNGLVLLTVDGGQSWQPVSWGQTPRLHGIQMFSVHEGLAWGESTTAHPGGWFRTKRGGSHWQHLSSNGTGNWLAGDFSPSGRGLLASDRGTLALVEGNRLTPLPLSRLNDRIIRAVHYSEQSPCWAVGERGLILRGDPGGLSWEAVVPDVSRAEQYDWFGLHASGDKVWVCGSPGDVILFSPDNGRSWQRIPTGVSLPLYDIAVSGDRGIAVGAFGRVLLSQDGGKTWHPALRGPTRAGVLLLEPTRSRVPFSLCAYVGESLLVTAVATPVHQVEDEAAVDRLDDALAQCGFALDRSSRLLPAAATAGGARETVAMWSRAVEGAPLATLDAEIAKLIRVWRPSVVVVGDDLDTGAYAQLLVDSVRRVSERLGSEGVPGPQRLYAMSSSGSLRVPGAAPAPAAGTTTSVLAATALALLDDGGMHVEQDATPLVLVWARDAGAHLAGKGIWAGLRTGDEVKRPVNAAIGEDSYERLHAAAEAYERAMALTGAAASGGDQARDPAILAHVRDMVGGLSDEQAGFLLAELARQRAKVGDFWGAEQLYGLLLTDYSRHLEAPSAWRWFCQFYASEEIQVWLARKERSVRREVVPVLQAAVTRPLLSDRPGTDPEPVTVEVTTSQLETASGAVVTGHWYRLARAAYDRLLSVSPQFAAAPSVMLPVASLARRTGDDAMARTYYATLALRSGTHQWRGVGEQEKWLHGRTGSLSREPVTVVWGKPPRLDASLDDDLWQGAKFYPLRSVQSRADDRYATRFAVGTDGRFLFLAVQARHPKGEPLPRPRSRRHDEDLERADRVIIALDVDRDYYVFYQLQVDRRGRCADSCWGVAQWNPRWYIAAADTQQAYTVELAVPLEELTLVRPEARTVWAINVCRIVPGEYVSALDGPIGEGGEVPGESLRLLLFAR